MNVYVVSDSIGDTCEMVVKAALSQFQNYNYQIKKCSFIDDQNQLFSLLEEMDDSSVIAYTIILPEVKDLLQEEAEKRGIPSFDIMGPIMHFFSSILEVTPQMEPGLNRQLDQDYYNRVAAIEFAVRCDDGKDLRGLMEADLVLTGISRTSKTPLSMYLAYQGIKVANLPLVPEVNPPSEIFSVPSERVVGLMIDPEELKNIRRQRLKNMQFNLGASYGRIERILAELDYAEALMKRIGCRIIDVTDQSIEESASTIINY